NIASGDIWWSHEIYRIFGRRPDEFKPSYESFLAAIHPEDVELVKNSEQNATKTGYHDVIHRIERPDNEVRIVHELGEVEYDELGNPQIMRGTIHDITEMKRAEEERNQLQRQLQQAQKMESIGHLTGGIAHDFNNILSSILGFSHLAIARFAPDRQGALGEYLNEIEKAGQRATDLVKQMLAFSRGDNQKQIVLNPNYIIKESVQMLRPTIATSINISYQDSPDSDIHIYTDPLQLQQTIINLVINARDALNGKGNITIKLTTHHLPSMECTSCHKLFSGEYVAISVIDDGFGIGEEYLARIFEPFFTTKDIGQGSGMGLAMVHGFIHASNGHILVDSNPDHGTSIQMYFPLCQVENDSSDNNLVAKDEIKPIEAFPNRILIVDDEPTIVRLLTDVLELAGYQVEATTCSTEALSMFENNPTRYDALLTDQSMPELTGIELVNHVRRINSTIPVILCSGYSENVNESNCEAFSINRYLHKPIDHELLLQTIQEIINRNSGEV
ncbi:MAG: response regulator, partial [Gammaproteobacteria bacterium]